MHEALRPDWGPRPLADLLDAELKDRGLSPIDGARCAKRVNKNAGLAAAADSFVDLAACRFQLGDIDGALAAWRHSATGPHNHAAARALLHMGLVHEQVDQHEFALQLFAASSGRGVEAYAQLADFAAARSMYRLGRADEAIDSLALLAEDVMSDSPAGLELAEVLYALGEVASNSGNTDRACTAWRVAAADASSPWACAAQLRLVDHYLGSRRLDLLEESLVRDDLDWVGQLATSEATRAVTIAQRLMAVDQDLAAAFANAIDAAQVNAVQQFELAIVRSESGSVNSAIDVLEVLAAHEQVQVRDRALVTLAELYTRFAMPDAASSMLERVSVGDGYWRERGASLAERSRSADVSSSPSLAAEAELVDVPDTTGSGAAASFTARFKAASTSQVSTGEMSTSEPSKSVGTADDGLPTSPSVDTAPAHVERDGVASANGARLGSGSAAIAGPPPAVEIPGVASTAMASSSSAAAEPVIVELDQIEATSTRTGSNHAGSDRDGLDPKPRNGFFGSVIDDAAHDHDVVERPRASPGTFARRSVVLDRRNPYAALAPDGDSGELPSVPNPYAELAPNYSGDDFAPRADVEPGDWESLLDDWPEVPTPATKRGASAFSRHNRDR